MVTQSAILDDVSALSSPLIITHSRLLIGLCVTCAVKPTGMVLDCAVGLAENVIAETVSRLDSSRNPCTPRIDCRDVESSTSGSQTATTIVIICARKVVRVRYKAVHRHAKPNIAFHTWFSIMRHIVSSASKRSGDPACSC
jgi:hypothetical protein